MHPLVHYAALGLAGAVGTILRAACTNLAVRLFGTAFPWGTLAVNVLGSFAFGLIVGSFRGRAGIAPAAETILLVGLLGGFTTYSSYAFQTLEMAATGRTLGALAYVLVTNAGSLAAVWAGLSLALWLVSSGPS
jgi:CrcB protein